MEEEVLCAVNANTFEDSAVFARDRGLDHNAVVGVLNRLAAFEFVNLAPIQNNSWELTDEAQHYVTVGTPEAQVFNAIPEEGIAMADLQGKVDTGVAKIGFAQGMQQKWFRVDKTQGSRVYRKVESIVDTVREMLLELQRANGAFEALNKANTDLLKRRQLIRAVSLTSFKVSKGPKFAMTLKKEATDLTAEMIASDSWKEETFKGYNFNARGLQPPSGYLHPLLKVKAAFREIFLEMGFEEMPTNNYVESSFWNFDALFQPQAHPARDLHDTFFLSDPAAATQIPEDYMACVKEVHEVGGYGSIGYRCAWKEEEARKNIMRTHTTAVSARMLRKLAQNGFQPAKYFSIDRVFRNETLDATHLAEFHQIEGVACDRGICLRDLLGLMATFFEKMGMPKLRFKPAYNPYTEPSMEIFAWHSGLNKWIEVGNSGMFRPEMLRPMGLPEDVHVLGWGLSLERPTMILYEIKNMRALFGHRVDINMIRENPICRLEY